MSFILGNWFSSAFSKKNNQKLSFKNTKKLSRQDISDFVWRISSLDMKQKKIVKDYLFQHLDDGGVEKYEFENAIAELSRKRVALGLSEIDIKNLKKILY